MIRNITLSILKTLHLESSQFSTMASKKIAVCQMTSIADKSANLNVVSQLISDAAKDGVKMLFFPECCDYICENKQETIKLSENLLTGETVKKYRELAATHNVWLSMGGLHEKDEASIGKIFNTHIIINDKGDIVQTYRKLHLFDVDIPERKIRLKESDFCNPGAHIVAPIDTPIGKLGLSICYDLRFPELSTSLSMMRAEILTYPSAFTYATGLAHWHVLLRARAIENQCYVVAAAQTGEHSAKRRSFGHALVVDPWGEVLADCGDSAPCYKVVEITDRLQEVRRNMPVFQHRRPDVYSLYSLSIRNKPFNEPPPSPPRTPPLATTGNVFGHVSVPETCVFHKSELTYAFVNLRCVTPGHVLVAPIRLAERNKDLTDEEASDFFKPVRLIQNLMERVHNTQSCTVTIQDGPDAGQTVKHLHCHIMPRKKGDFIENDLIYLELAKHDQMKSGHPAKPARSLEEMESEAKYLREELKKMIETSKNNR